MTIKDEKTYNEIEKRMETLLAKGTQLGGMDFLCEVEKEELKVLSEAAYDWECEVDPHPWRVAFSHCCHQSCFSPKRLQAKGGCKSDRRINNCIK